LVSLKGLNVLIWERRFLTLSAGFALGLFVFSVSPVRGRIFSTTVRTSIMRFPLRYQTQANKRAVMLIGDGRETNPASEFYAWVESIDDVVGKFVCTDCQGYGTLPSTQSHTSHPRKCPLCKGAGFLLVGL